jgi:hypothetical protein
VNEKKLLKNRDVDYVHFPRLKSLTVEYVLNQALGHDDIKHYLPNPENVDTTYMDRSFVFGLVNTLEPTFFDRCLQQYHDKNEIMKHQASPKVVITNEMMEVLTSYIKTSWQEAASEGQQGRSVPAAR